MSAPSRAVIAPPQKAPEAVTNAFGGEVLLVRGGGGRGGGGGMRGGGGGGMRGGGGFSGGGGRSFGGGAGAGGFSGGGGRNIRSSAGSSVNYSGGARNANFSNRTGNGNFNGNTFNRNVNVNGNGGCCWNGGWDHPVAAGLAVGAVAGVTAAAIGSTYYSLPPGCASPYSGYYQCGSTWYQPQYSGTNVQYTVVNPPADQGAPPPQ
jgi:hypothetical protein